jgi:ECF transporter S component (folate family)
LINRNNAYYQATCSIENIESIEHNKLVDSDFLNEIKDSGANGKYQNIDVEKMLEKQHFSYTINGDVLTIKTMIKYYDDFFLKKTQTVETRAKMFIKDSILAISNGNEVVFENPTNIIERHNYISKWFYSLLAILIGFVVEIFVSLILCKKAKENVDEYVCDNVEVFSSCFYKAYWKESCKPLKKVKDITAIAMLFALMLACKFIPIPSGFGNLGLSFTYLFFSIIAMIYGPIYGVIIGIFSDLIGFLIDSNGGAFNIGYTIQAALTGFIYGICFFRRRITFRHALFARVLVNLLMNVVLGSFLFVFVAYVNNDATMTFAKYLELVKSYMLLLELPKNLIYLLPQSLLLFFVLKSTLPVLKRYRLVPKEMIIKKYK